MAQNPAVTMTRFDWMEQNGAAKLTIDNDKLRQMGLSRKEVATALQAEISGYTVAQYLEGDQAIDMVFRLQPVDRSTVTELETLTIPTSAGAVPLSQVARLSYESENGMIWRRNLLPTITVCGGIGEGVTGNDITQQVYDDLADLRQNLPNGVTIEIGGSLEDSAKTLGYLLEPVPVMLLLMMILLMLQLKDIRKLFIILCTAPLGVTGVMLGLIIFNAPLGFMAELGILALTGIIIRNFRRADRSDRPAFAGRQISLGIRTGISYRTFPPYYAGCTYNDPGTDTDVYQPLLEFDGRSHCLWAVRCYIADLDRIAGHLCGCF